MKAVVYRRYGSPDVLEVEEVATPVPAADEVLVRNHASVVSAADSAARRGVPYFSRLFFGLRRPKWPILGSSFAGDVAAVGEAVTGFKAGDQLFGVTGAAFGAHAEYVCLSEGGALSAKPTNLTYSEAAAVCDGAVSAVPFLRDVAQLRRGQKILVNGASGGIGTAAVQLAKHFGAHVTAVTSTRNLELVESLGADEVIDYTNENFTRARSAYDVIFDAVGKSSFSRCRGALTPRGIYLTTAPSPAIGFHMLWTSRAGGKRARFSFTGLRPPTEKAKDLVLLRQLAEAGGIRPVIDRSYPLDQAAEAHRHVDTGHKTGAAVVTVA